MNAQDTLWQRLEEFAEWASSQPRAVPSLSMSADLRAAAQIVKEAQSPQYDDQTIQPLAEVAKLSAENEELRAKLAEAEKDAERYRWLRDIAPHEIYAPSIAKPTEFDGPKWLHGEAVDNAIDAARKP